MSNNHLHVFSLKCIIFAFIGFTMGLLVDYSLHKIQKNNEIRPMVLITLQLMTTILIFFIIDNYVSTEFMIELQTSIAGLFFVVMYFNSQLNFSANIKKLLYNGNNI